MTIEATRPDILDRTGPTARPEDSGQPVTRPVNEHAALDRYVAADLQAYFEHQMELAYLRGRADERTASALHDPDDIVGPPRFDFVEALEAVLSSVRVPFPGRARVEVIDRHGKPWTFHRADYVTVPDDPTLIRLEASRPLSADEVTRLRDLAAYAYQATVRGSTFGQPYVDSPYSFVVPADTSESRRAHPMVALDDFERRLAEYLHHGSPIRKTDKAGRGTAGTRAVPGLGDPNLRIAIYYDRVRSER